MKGPGSMQLFAGFAKWRNRSLQLLVLLETFYG